MGLGKVNNKTQKWNENNNLNFIVGKYNCHTSKFKEREREVTIEYTVPYHGRPEQLLQVN